MKNRIATNLVSAIKQNKIQFILPFILFCLYLCWAALLPASEAPDELARIQVPFFIANNNYLPSGWEESIRNPLWGISYAFSPYGSSLIALPFIKIASLFTNDTGVIVFATRIPSCMFGALTVAILMKASKLLNFNDQSRLLMGVTLGLLPQFAFLSSYHNQDIFSAFCASLVLLCWVQAIKKGWSVKICLYLGVSLGLLALSYYFAYAFIPLSVLFFFVTAKWQKIPLKRTIKYALLVFIVAFAIAGWFFIRNMFIYNGDFFGRNAYYECSEMYAIESLKPSTHITPKLEGQSITDVLFSEDWLWTTFKSSISYLGFMEFSIQEEWIYMICCALICIAVVVSFKISVFDRTIEIIKGNIKDNREVILLWVLLAISAFSALMLSLYYSWSADWQPQGRYIISSWIPTILALQTLYHQITSKYKRSSSAKSIFIGFSITCSMLLLVIAIHSSYPICFNGVMFEWHAHFFSDY